MKKVVLAIAVFAVFGLVSCNKEKTCECTTVYTPENDFFPPTVTEGKTKEKCSSLDTKASQGEYTLTTTCKEK